jgi:hypothetical protein
MALTLATRIGPDTLGKLERAARRRFAEARKLAADEPLGAIYLYGYSVEIRLKAAYFRTMGLGPSSPISQARAIAEAQTRTLLGVRGPVGHNLYGWATLLQTVRLNLSKPLDSAMVREMYAHVLNIEACWTEVIRYRANRPYDEEIQAVQTGANWFRVNASRLWR